MRTLLLIAFFACNPAPAPEPPVPTASEALEALDPRTPVPLQPHMAWHQKQNMQEHLVAIQEITAALVDEDWAAIEAATARIGSSPEKAMQCEHMGAGADGFTERALDFHARADRIAEAARTEDAKAVLAATAHTLAACTSCHATYRQELVDADTYTARAGAPAPMHAHE